ncbi:uncharacterized protein LOC135492979 [Lineus longissimus]|uniref:uncharacterized protein LOC135492979 n=1 Tax=Lineus longissimus TaxID=88925 RepID=UPI00315C5E65
MKHSTPSRCNHRTPYIEGAMRSFITTQSATKLGANDNGKEIINLTAFGGKTDTVRQISKTDSPTTPIRIVYDASCRAAGRSSLNDCLEPGPNLLNDLGRILLRFRIHPVGLSSDIQKAFLHVKLAEADQMFTKFLWLGDPDDPESRFRTVQFQVVPFGTVSSPFMLLATIKTHLDSYDTPLAADIQENTYMDNIFASIQPTDAMTYYEKANEMMDDADLKLRAWTSNDTTIRQRAQADNIDDPKPKVPAHGMIWDTEADTLTFNNRNKP